MTDIHRTLTILKHRNVIFEEFGFNEVEPAPKAILNFYGPPGTGKTMMAHAIAHSLGLKILALNYADIESKFVGDAPKNLVRAFETASKEKALLFFDESDSFLGKRISNVSSSSDQAVNSLRSQMLILLENFDGIVIFATNLITNYDRAFESRIFKHLRFDLPDAENRAQIIQRMIPNKVPFADGERLTSEQIETLVQISDGFSGREIKNAILEALTHAVFEDRRIVKFVDFQLGFEQVKTSQYKLRQEQDPGRYDPATLKKKQLLEEKIKENLAANKGEASMKQPHTDTTLL